jgi:hypothetical protein
LLVAARERKNWRFDAWRLDGERAERRADLVQLFAVAHDPERGKPVERSKGCVFTYGEAGGQALRMPVRRHEGGLLQKFLDFQRTSLKIDRPFGRLKPGEGPHQLRLAIALHSGHADDLPPRHFERYVVKSSTGQRLYGKDHLS